MPKELALANTQGIDEKRVKVLPIKFRDAEMPSELGDIYYADADRFDLDALAEMLAKAIRRHQGDDSAVQLVDPDGGSEPRPRRTEPSSPSRIEHLDAVAERCFDLLAQWDRCRISGEPQDRLADKPRRLRYALEALPDWIRVGLPVIGELSTGSWDSLSEILGSEPESADSADVYEELGPFGRTSNRGCQSHGDGGSAAGLGRWMISIVTPSFIGGSSYVATTRTRSMCM